MEQADKIARDLGKEAPNVEYDIDEIPITHDQEEAVKNSFIHLIRNALDHGIETRDERIKKGKPSNGLKER